MIFFSVLIYRLCNKHAISAAFWIFRFVSLSIGFELCIALIFASIYGVDFYKNVKQMMIIAVVNLLVILLLYLLVRKNIEKIIDDNDDMNLNDKNNTPPEKDLSYFR